MPITSARVGFLLAALAASPGNAGAQENCHVTIPERPVTRVSDVAQCPRPEGDPNQCGPHCIVDISGSPVGRRDWRKILKEALQRCNTTVRLLPAVDLDFSPTAEENLRPLYFGRCVTLTSVNDPDVPTPARTPRTRGPLLKYGPADELTSGTAKSFLSIACRDTSRNPRTEHVRISGFRLEGPTTEQQFGQDVGIRITDCKDVEIFNMEIYGWGGNGIAIQGLPNEPPHDFNEIRIHDNFIHHNQHPTHEGHAGGYGVETANWGVRANIYRNVFDFNRHAIAAGGHTGGYIAAENLVLRGGGWHGGSTYWTRTTHLFDVHGTGCWWSKDECGDAGEEFHFYRNAFQYQGNNAIHIRGKPFIQANITENVFPHEHLEQTWWGYVRGWFGAIRLNTHENVQVDNNILDTNTYLDYSSECDFDGDGIDDLFLATGQTWWYSSAGKFQWTFLNTSSTRIKDLRFGYFDNDNVCDVVTESGDPGRWMISSGGTGGWKPLEEVWLSHPVREAWKPLGEVQFGRFDPTDLTVSRSRRTTHAFWRAPNGGWHVKKLADPESAWEHIGGSSFPMNALRFGDFNGDGVTDVLAGRGRTLGVFGKRPQTMAASQSLTPRPGSRLIHCQHGLG